MDNLSTNDKQNNNNAEQGGRFDTLVRCALGNILVFSEFVFIFMVI